MFVPVIIFSIVVACNMWCSLWSSNFCDKLKLFLFFHFLDCPHRLFSVIIFFVLFNFVLFGIVFQFVGKSLYSFSIKIEFFQSNVTCSWYNIFCFGFFNNLCLHKKKLHIKEVIEHYCLNMHLSNYKKYIFM